LLFATLVPQSGVLGNAYAITPIAIAAVQHYSGWRVPRSPEKG
jgi:hypothetical protein